VLAILAGNNNAPVSIIKEEPVPAQEEPAQPPQPAVPTGE